MFQEIESSGFSQTGPIREENQDAIRMQADTLASGRGRLYAVADGIGGYAHGGIASALALEKLFETFYGERGAPALKRLRRGLEAANLGVYQTAQRLGVGRMGTTLTAAHVLGDRLYLAHVGDSRAYLIRGGRATCLTEDHTVVGDLVRMKVLAPEKVRAHEQRSVLTRSLGLKLFVNPDLSEHTLKNDDRLLLCSDGVWAVIEDEEFAWLAAEARGSEALAQAILNLALERHTDDNVSVIAVHLRRLAPRLAEQKGRRGWSWAGFRRSR
jgi:serine/threonine protein phosphatase PrpC